MLLPNWRISRLIRLTPVICSLPSRISCTAAVSTSPALALGQFIEIEAQEQINSDDDELFNDCHAHVNANIAADNGKSLGMQEDGEDRVEETDKDEGGCGADGHGDSFLAGRDEAQVSP